MEKILLAVGNREMEEYLKSTLKNEVQFVGETVYREGVIRAIGQTGPSLVVLRDALRGTLDMISLIYEIRKNYPNVRILFIGVPREKRDTFYGTLVNYGVYDLVVGGSINVAEIIERIRLPGKHGDVTHFQPAPTSTLNPNSGITPPQVITLSEEKEKEEEDHESRPEPVKVPDTTLEKTTGGKFGKLGLFKKREGKEELDVGEKQGQKIVGIKPEAFSSNRIVTFLGGRSGVGTTTIAVNTAFALAESGKSVLYIEVNQKHPSASYWYDTGKNDWGIDTALKAIKEKKYAEVQKSITKAEELKSSDSPMKANYKKFPKRLDFLSYSKEYILGMYLREDMMELKELYLYLMYQVGYDYIVLDLSYFAEDKDIQGAIMFSNKVFTVVNQDVSTIGYHISTINTLEQDGVSIKQKNNYIVNSYTKSKFGAKDIKEWLDVKNLILVPQSTVEMSESNAKGLPTVIDSKRSEFTSSINEIINIIGGK